MILSQNVTGVRKRKILRRLRHEIEAATRAVERLHRRLKSGRDVSGAVLEGMERSLHRFNQRSSERFFERGGPKRMQSKYPGNLTEDLLHAAVVALLGSQGRLWAADLPGYLDACVRRSLSRRHPIAEEFHEEFHAPHSDPEIQEADRWADRLVLAWVLFDRERADLLAMGLLKRGRMRELANALGIEEGTLRVRLHRVRARFKKYRDTSLAARNIDPSEADQALLRALHFTLKTPRASRSPELDRLLDEAREAIRDACEADLLDDPATCRHYSIRMPGGTTTP